MGIMKKQRNKTTHRFQKFPHQWQALGVVIKMHFNTDIPDGAVWV